MGVRQDQAQRTEAFSEGLASCTCADMFHFSTTSVSDLVFVITGFTFDPKTVIPSDVFAKSRSSKIVHST